MKKSFDSSFFRLSLMMLLQYMIFAVWWVPFAAYLVNINVAGVVTTIMSLLLFLSFILFFKTEKKALGKEV